MGTKRSHDEMRGTLQGMHTSRKAALQPQKSDQRRPKKNKSHRVEASASFNTTSVNPLKKKIRDLTRLLDRAESMPADVRIDGERALEAYRQELAAAEEDRQRQRMIKKYHMVRFFGMSSAAWASPITQAEANIHPAERQKATRLLKRLRKKLAASSSPDESAELKKRLHEADVDLHYTLYCPIHQKYTALYAAKGAEVGREAGKSALWLEVERRMEEGTLNDLRNVRTVAKDRSTASSIPKKSDTGNDARRRSTGKTAESRPMQSEAKAADADEDDASDGGFFE